MDEVAQLQARGRMALMLPGWDRFSVWGWDDRQGSLFAQLWQNNDNGRDEPRTWISPVTGWLPITSPEVLAGAIVGATGCGMPSALLAMAHQAPGELGEHLRALAA